MTQENPLGWAEPVPRWRDPRQWLGLLFIISQIIGLAVVIFILFKLA